MATIRDISHKCGVSITTVSKVLNNVPGISQETTRRVLQAAEELNYRPNLSARQLKTGASRTIGIITEDLTVFNAPSIIDGIGVTCEANHYHYILGNLRFNKRFGSDPFYSQRRTELVTDMVADMCARQVDGIIYVGCHSHKLAHMEALRNTKLVCAYCCSSDPQVPYVVYDDRRAAYNATMLLIRGGCRKLGTIVGDVDSSHTSERLQGFQEALFDSGLPYNPRLTRPGNWQREKGYQCAKILIDSGVDGIFAQNDLMAMGVIDYCSQIGVQIGTDVMLIGFDDREAASACQPSLSTVALPLFEIGTRAAGIMIDLLSGKECPEPNAITLDCHIIRRESSGIILDGEEKNQ